MTATHKDQLRALKSVVQSKLNAPFKPRAQMQFPESTVISPSASQSECSTLIDFGSEYTAEDLEYGEPETGKFGAIPLEDENCAWTRPVRAQVSSKCKVATAGDRSPYTAQMLDVEDRAWDSSRPKGSLPTRILQAFAGR